MTLYLYIQFYVFCLFIFLVRTQGPADIAASIADAVTEVSERRSGGGVLTAAAAGDGALGGVAAPGTGSVADNPVYIHALFSKRREAPGAVAAACVAGDITLTATAKFAARNGGALPDEGEFRRQIAPFCPVHIAVCNSNDRYRTADGTCNNLFNPLWGASITLQRRFIPPEYGDPPNLGTIPRIRSRVTGFLLPSPRVITNAVHNAGISPPRSVIYNVALTHFGQFIDHDVISTPIHQEANGNDIDCCIGDIPVIRPECFSFLVPTGDFTSVCMHFVRSDIGVDPGCPPGPRNPINQRTSYLHLSVTYGNTDDGVADLREPLTGRLQEGIGRLLPNGGSECIAGDVCVKSGERYRLRSLEPLVSKKEYLNIKWDNWS